MTCTSCEVIIERKLLKLNGVEDVTVKHQHGTCVITQGAGQHLKFEDIQEALGDTEYELMESNENSENMTRATIGWKHWWRIGVTVVLVYWLAKMFGIFSFNSTVSESLSYPAIFGIGLVASVSSCIAVVGGLILTFTAKIKQVNPNASRWELIRTHLFFNIGRLMFYFIFGGIVGVIGTALAPSPRVMGLISMLVALVMIVLALDLLGVSGSKKWIPKMPKKWSHKIHDLAEREEWWIPFVLGALTFFLPCGFTQSMQLYALTTGSFFQGGMTLFVFALGTLPALFGIGLLASFTKSKGKAYKYFMLIAGSIVLLLGLMNLQSSLNLLGINTNRIFSFNTTTETGEQAVVGNGVQIVEMAVQGIEYLPSQITIQKGVPVEWRVDGAGATGCTSILTIPSLGISERLSRSEVNIINFTPTKTGTLPFTCGMGMSYGEFNVVEVAAEIKPEEVEECDSSIQNCIK